MKILHINTHELRGGAAQAAHYILQGERDLGLDASVLVAERESDRAGVIEHGGGLWRRLRWWLDTLPYRLAYPARRGDLALQWLPDTIANAVARINPDLIHLHWFYGGFMRLETLAQFRKPILWTLHDEWAFTGGCFYSRDCKRYRDSCGACPDLGARKDNDLTRWVFQRKKHLFPQLHLEAATYSSAMITKAAQSTLFSTIPVHLVLNAVDTDFFTPADATEARQRFNLPAEKKILLWAAYDISTRVKGFASLSEALAQLPQQLRDQLLLVALGARNGMQAPVGIETRFPGLIRDPAVIRTYYRAADCFVSSSAHEVGPQTVMEAMACGVPCVGYGVGGHLDRIQHRIDGCLATPASPADLAAQIDWLLSDAPRRRAYGQAARHHAVAAFSIEAQARNYIAHYQQMLSGPALPS